MHMLDDLLAKLRNQGTVDVIVRVRPHAAKTQLVDVLQDGSIKVDIAAPAEDNKGNAALVRFLSEQFGVPKTHVKILSGTTARMKLVRIVASS